jgi:hypothetical protein
MDLPARVDLSGFNSPLFGASIFEGVPGFYIRHVVTGMFISTAHGTGDS